VRGFRDFIRKSSRLIVENKREALMARRILLAMLLLPGLTQMSWGEDAPGAASKKEDPVSRKDAPDRNVIRLFDGRTLKGWKSTNFGGEGDVEVKDGQILLHMGSNLTGITWQNADELPKSNYEISLEAMRVLGSDFFCGLTLPSRDGAFSLILGGWGGGVCGISCIDGFDASENETTLYREFKKEQWYKVRLRVTDNRIQAWIDDKEAVDADVTGRKLSVRIEVDLSRPLGFASWQTTAALKNITLRRLTEADLKSTDGEPTDSGR